MENWMIKLIRDLGFINNIKQVDPDALMEIINNLPEQKKFLIIERYLHNRTYKSIGTSFNPTWSSTKVQIESFSILRMLRNNNVSKKFIKWDL